MIECPAHFFNRRRAVQKLDPIDIIRSISGSRYTIARMQTALDPFSFLVTAIAGWMNQHQHHVIDYLIEENAVLREEIGNRRLRFSDDQRRRLAAKALVFSFVFPPFVRIVAPDVTSTIRGLSRHLRRAALQLSRNFVNTNWIAV